MTTAHLISSISRILILALILAGCSIFSSSEVRRGDRFVEAGNWEEAVLAYQRALRDDAFDRSVQGKLALARAQAANKYEEQARALVKDRKIDQAVEAMKHALTFEPARVERHQALADILKLKEAQDQVRTAEQLRNIGRLDEAMEAFQRAVTLDPGLTTALEGISALSEKLSGGRRGDKLNQPITLRFQNAKIKEVFEVLARAGGINVVFDKDVKNDAISIFIQDTPFEDAMNLILSSNSLFSVRVDAETILITPNTKQKQEQYQDLMIRTFYLQTMKAKDMVALLKGMLDTKRMYANEPINAVVIRDHPDKLKLAERIILANDRPEPEVLFDLEVLEVNRTKSMRYGLTYGRYSASAQVSGSLGTDNPGSFLFRELKNLGDQTYLFTLPGSVQLDFFKQESDARTLAAPKLRVVNGKKGEVNIGDKQPILLSTTNVLPGQVTTGSVPTTSTVTSIEFRDTGIKLAVEPTIRLMNELALKMKVEVTRLGDEVTLQASPPIKTFRFGNRTAETILQMKDGETVVLAGLIQDEDRKSRTSLPWLGDLPLIGWLFSGWTTDKVTTEVILTITPHIIQPMSPASPEMQMVWSGTEMLYSTKPLFSSAGARPVSLGGSGREPGGPPAGMPSAQAPSLPPTAAPVSSLTSRLVVKPTEVTAEVGQVLQVMLSGESLEGLEDASVTVGFDPQILEFKNATEGDLLRQGNPPGTVTAAPAPGGGTVVVTVKRAGLPLSGNGLLAVLNFESKGVGVSPVSLVTPNAARQGQRLQLGIGGQAMVRVR
jgi:general secretion pathway protein D